MAVAVGARAEALRKTRHQSFLSVVWGRFRRHQLAVASLFVMAVVLLAVIFADAGPLVHPANGLILRPLGVPRLKPGLLVAPYDPLHQDLAIRNQGPSRAHWLGTDELGRDVFSRLLFAGRMSLLIAFAVSAGSQVIGVLVGAISGYYGHWLDSTLMRLVDFMQTLPTLPVLLVLSKILGGSVPVLILVLTAFGWMGAARLVRGMVLSLREQAFTEASRALGVSNWRIITHHMIPNSMAPVIVSATFSVGITIIIESGLSFLGFGVRLPTPTWGNMLQNVQSDMFMAPWKAFFPGFCILITVLAFNFIGDGLRDALDPRLKM
jgi:peptide/nickel transport system permease protein